MHKIGFINFNGNKLKLKHIFNCSKTALMLDWESAIFELMITTLVSSTTRICMEFPIKISRTFFYIRNNRGPKIDCCRTPHAILCQSEEVLFL